jgi:hypothetical protein
MAYPAYDAVLTRVREVIEDSRGTLRTVPSSWFLGDLPEGLDVGEEARRGIVGPRVDAEIVGMAPNPSSPPTMGNVMFTDVDILVRVIRTITPLEQLDDDSSVALRALAAKDAEVLRQALGYAGNLTTTQAGTATGIVSGLLRWTKTGVKVKRVINEGAQPIETQHNFRGIVRSAPAVA